MERDRETETGRETTKDRDHEKVGNCHGERRRGTDRLRNTRIVADTDTDSQRGTGKGKETKRARGSERARECERERERERESKRKRAAFSPAADTACASQHGVSLAL